MPSQKKIINAWCMYDWANSAYNLVITSSMFPAYYEFITRGRQPNNEVTFLGRQFVNTALYHYALGAAFIVVALISPVLTAIADTRGNKKDFMRFFCFMGAIACSAPYFFAPVNTVEGTLLTAGVLHFGIFCIVISCVGFWASLVFYNSYLPDLVDRENRDRISAKGFTFGYIGSVILQVICFIIYFFPQTFGFYTQYQINHFPARVSFLLVGLWWIGFAQIPLYYLPKGNLITASASSNVFSTGFRELKKVWQQVKQLPVLKRFLYSFFCYSVGIQTIFLVATPFGAKELRLETGNLILTIMIIQLVAIPGAILISRLSERFGNLQTLAGVVFVWIIVCAFAYNITTGTGFYALGAVVGLVMGGIQSLSRSTYANLMPPTKDTASFFSFYDVTEKIALVLGLFTFAYLEELTGSMRNSILALMFFFFAGMLMLFSSMKIQKQRNTVDQ